MASAFGKCLIIGISGVTNSGKTSLCDKFAKVLAPKVTTMNMDDYFWPEDNPKHIYEPECNGHANWEALESVDFESMYQDVIKWKEKANIEDTHRILLIEGILIFNFKPLVPLFHRKYFFTLTKEQCYERRKIREYIPPDPEGYYDKVVWPMYLQNKEHLDDIKDIVYLNGTEYADMTFDVVLRDIQKLLERKDIKIDS